jgi:hypothetical protein
MQVTGLNKKGVIISGEMMDAGGTDITIRVSSSSDYPPRPQLRIKTPKPSAADYDIEEGVEGCEEKCTAMGLKQMAGAKAAAAAAAQDACFNDFTMRKKILSVSVPLLFLGLYLIGSGSRESRAEFAWLGAFAVLAGLFCLTMAVN